MSMTPFTITPLSGHTGAEVVGLDFTEPVDAEIRTTLNRAFAEHHRRGGIPRIPRGLDRAQVPHPRGGAGMDLHAEQARAAGLFAWPLARCRQQLAEQGT